MILSPRAADRVGVARCLAGACLVAALFASASLAQEKPIDQAKWRFTQEEQPLTDLIDASAAMIGQSVLYNPAEISGTVRLRLAESVSAEGLWDLANESLASRGLTTVQVAGSDALQVVSIANAPALARVEDFSAKRTKAGFVKVLFRPEREKADVITEGIKLVLSKAGTVTSLRDPNALIVADLKPNVAQALHLAVLLDGNVDDLRVEEVALGETVPIQLAAMVEQVTNAKKAVFGDKFKGTVIASPTRRSVLVIGPESARKDLIELVKQFDRAEPMSTVHYTPRRFGVRETAKLVDEVVFGGAGEPANGKMVIDELTGALIITANASDHAAINDLLNRLDAADLGPRRLIRSFPIKNRSVEEVTNLLDTLLSRGALVATAEPATPTQGATAPLSAATITASNAPIPELTLTADEATNRLVAIGEARMLDQLANLIETIDVRASQVLVETLVVTLSDTETRDLGAELQAAGLSGDSLLRLSSLFGLGVPDVSKTTLPAASGSGLSGVVLNPGDFSALVRALGTVNHGRSLTMPKVLVNNHQEAKLGSTLQTPFVSTNASTTVATTSYGGSVDAGTSISVKPSIAEGDQLLLDYSVSLSSFVGDSTDPALPPPRQENKLQSSATVPDGHTVVVGGLEVERDDDARSQVPILGDIPVLGALFQSRSATKSKSRFYVFIRASVLRAASFEDLKYVSASDRRAAGLPSEFPELEPRVIR